MKRVVTIIGSGMMGSALAFPAAENGHEVRLVGSPLDRDIIDCCVKSNRHPKFDRDFPSGVKFYQIDDYKRAVEGADFVIGGEEKDYDFLIKNPKDHVTLTLNEEGTVEFKAGDKTEYIFEYFCEHEYGVSDPSKPCGSFCTKCGCANPEPEVPHSWGAATVKSERGMLTPLDQTVTCTVCGASHSQYAQPYILYIGVVGAALVLAVGITLAIVLPIRRRKKLRDMTW